MDRFLLERGVQRLLAVPPGAAVDTTRCDQFVLWARDIIAEAPESFAWLWEAPPPPGPSIATCVLQGLSHPEMDIARTMLRLLTLFTERLGPHGFDSEFLSHHIAPALRDVMAWCLHPQSDEPSAATRETALKCLRALSQHAASLDAECMQPYADSIGARLLALFSDDCLPVAAAAAGALAGLLEREVIPVSPIAAKLLEIFSSTAGPAFPKLCAVDVVCDLASTQTCPDVFLSLAPFVRQIFNVTAHTDRILQARCLECISLIFQLPLSIPSLLETEEPYTRVLTQVETLLSSTHLAHQEAAVSYVAAMPHGADLTWVPEGWTDTALGYILVPLLPLLCEGSHAYSRIPPKALTAAAQFAALVSPLLSTPRTKAAQRLASHAVRALGVFMGTSGDTLDAALGTALAVMDACNAAQLRAAPGLLRACLEVLAAALERRPLVTALAQSHLPLVTEMLGCLLTVSMIEGLLDDINTCLVLRALSAAITAMPQHALDALTTLGTAEGLADLLVRAGMDTAWEVRESVLGLIHAALCTKDPHWCVWLVEVCDAPDMLQRAREDASEFVRMAAIKATGVALVTQHTRAALWPSGTAAAVLEETARLGLVDEEIFVRRATLEALVGLQAAQRAGGDDGAVESLLVGLHRDPAYIAWLRERIRVLMADEDWEVKLLTLEWLVHTGLGDGDMFSALDGGARIVEALDDEDRPVRLRACQILLEHAPILPIPEGRNIGEELAMNSVSLPFARSEDDLEFVFPEGNENALGCYC